MPTMPDGGTLALDLSGAGISNKSAIGWAYGLLSWKLPHSSRWPLPTEGVRGHRYAAYGEIINDTLEDWKPANVCIESPLPPAAQTDFDTCLKIYALVGLTEEACARASVKFSSCSVNTIRSNVIGRCHWPGGSDGHKAGVLEFVRKELKMDVGDHNEADAIICWLDYRQRMLNIPSAKEPLFRWGNAR